MESYSLEHMPTELSQIHLQLFKNVTNAAELRSGLVAAASLEGDAGERERERYDYCFIEAKTLLSRSHLLTAVHQALVAAARGTLATRTAHSEVLYALSPSNNITDSLRHFGVSPKTTSLALVKLGPSPALGGPAPADVARAMEALVEGDPVGLDALGESTADFDAVRKLYKLTVKEAEDRRRMEDVVVSTVAMKSVA